VNRNQRGTRIALQRFSGKQTEWFSSSFVVPFRYREASEGGGERVNGLLVAGCQYHAFARERITLFIYLFIYLFHVLFLYARAFWRADYNIAARFPATVMVGAASSNGGGGGGGCGMVCRRWIESGGVVVHLASCRPQPDRRVRPLTVFIPRILDVQRLLFGLFVSARGADNSRSRLIISLVDRLSLSLFFSPFLRRTAP